LIGFITFVKGFTPLHGHKGDLGVFGVGLSAGIGPSFPGFKSSKILDHISVSYLEEEGEYSRHDLDVMQDNLSFNQYIRERVANTGKTTRQSHSENHHKISEPHMSPEDPLSQYHMSGIGNFSKAVFEKIPT